MKPILFILVSMMWLAGSFHGFSASVPGDSIVFPGADEMEGWNKKGEIREFAANGLYGHIDGGSELFLEYGFQVLRLQRYQNGTDEISVEVYVMDNPEAALGIYLLKCGEEKPVPGVTARNTGDPYQITILKGNCFVSINNFNGKEPLLPVMVKFADKTLASIPNVKAKDLFSILPAEDRVKGTELLIRGMYSLQSVYTLGEGDILLLENKIFGVTAQFKGKDNTTYNRIIIRYPDSEYAKKVFSHLKKNLDSYIRVLENRNDYLEFKDYKEKIGKVFLKNDILDISYNLPF